MHWHPDKSQWMVEQQPTWLICVPIGLANYAGSLIEADTVARIHDEKNPRYQTDRKSVDNNQSCRATLGRTTGINYE